MRCKSIEDEKKYLSGNPIMKLVLKRFNKQIEELISYCRPRNVLDMGCGNGFIIKEIASAFPNAKITAFDIEAEKIKYAKQHNFCKNVRYVRADMFRPPFKKQKFDLVMSNEVLEHIPEYEKAMKIIKGMSSKYAIISVPREPWFRIATLLRLKHVSHLGNIPGHLNHWSKREIVRFLSRYGTIISAKTSAVWTIVLLKAK